MIPLVYRPQADIEQHHYRGSESDRGLSGNTENNWNDPDDGRKAEKEIYLCGLLDNIWENPENITKVNIRMEAQKEICCSGGLQYDWNSPRDAIKVKDDVKVLTVFNPAENCI